MKRIGVLTSGGDSPGMNAAVRGAVRTALNENLEVVGVRRGFQGLFDGDIFRMDRRSVSNIIQRGGSMLETSRCKEMFSASGRKTAADFLHRQGIDALTPIGGDGTLTGALLLAEECDVDLVCIPGTIDNDIPGTDFTIGFDTAINTALDAIDRIRDTASAMERIFVIEVMGRLSGSIALEVAVAGGAEGVLIPEKSNDLPMMMQNLADSIKKGKRTNIIVVSEGDETGGAAKVTEEIKTRLNVPVWVTILGHVQRGGSPTARDRVLASRLGCAAVKGLLAGKAGTMAGEIHGKIAYTPLSETIGSSRALNFEKLDLAYSLSK